MRRHKKDIFLAELLAQTVSSNHNQNIILPIEAKPGFGKSYAAMDLACDCAVALSDMCGGVPSDYFTIDNMAIIMPDEIVRVATHIEKRRIYIFDDFGVAYSSRKWQSKGNEAMNNALQTMRTKNNILLMTVPDLEWIDKIGRNIVHYKAYMSNKDLTDFGRTYGRFSAVHKLYNSQSRKNLYPYLKLPDTIYNQVEFIYPAPALTKIYDEKRDYQLARLDEENKRVLKTDITEANNRAYSKEPKITKKEIVEEKYRDYKAGVFEGMCDSFAQVMNMYNASVTKQHKISKSLYTKVQSGNY